MSVADVRQLELNCTQNNAWPFAEAARTFLPAGVAIAAARISCEAREPRKKRELEFQTGRQCADDALRQLGGDGPVERAEDRSPIWPPGFAGSITHNDKLCYAVVCHAADYCSLGIDVEKIVSSKTRSLLEIEIAAECEWDIVSQTNLSDEVNFTLIFSAKESFYKCWYPVNREYFGFQDAVVKQISKDEIQIASNEGNPNYLRSPSELTVRYLVADEYVFTATSMRSCSEAQQ